jgi:RAB protein geranylgeranyltransferase component A
MSVMKKEINNNSTITSPEQFLEYFTLRNFDHGLNIEDLDVFSTPHSIEDDEITISSSGPFNNLNAKIVQIYKPHIGCPSCYGYLMERTLQNDPQTFDAATLHPSFFGYVTDRKLTQSRAMHQQRNFNIDVTPKLVLAAGKMVDCIVSSGVGNYLEFKCIDNIFYATGVSGTSSSPDMNNKISNNNKNNSTIQLWKIPSSKSDIFNTKLFNALEKRKLMKLIQDAIDYGKQYDDENIMCSDIMKLNEIDLAKGRSLHRPQNKVSTIKNILSDNSDNLKLQKFIDYMKNVDKFSHSLQQFVLHGLCLESSTDISAEEGLLALYRHINASGRYGTTSFLSTVYGTSEFSQAFCRLSAVWGGIFILQKEVIKLLRNKITQKVFGVL